MAWGIAFLLIFYSFDLPNSRPKTSRREIWQLLPVLTLNLIDGPIEKRLGAPASGWVYIAQRFGILLVAGVILAAAWAVGSLFLRVIRPVGIRPGVERTVIAFALGLAGLSLITLGFGEAGLLRRDMICAVLSAAFVAECLYRFLYRSAKRTGPSAKQTGPSANRTGTSAKRSINSAERTIAADLRLKVACVTVMFPFLLAMLLGAMLPSVDFDVKEYHLQGPKEFYQNGFIGFLPHNVYTSFPFLTEMLSLLAMVLRADWFSGALAGKAVLMSFAPLTAMALFAAGRRWFGETVGWLAATIYLTTPWIYRISIIAYAEGGLTFYLFLTLLTVGIAVENSGGGIHREDKSPEGINPEENGRGLFLIGGFLAGSAMSCKYTGVLQVVIPLAVAVFGQALLRRETDEPRRDRLRKSFGFLAAFTIGTCLAVGPWLMKNVVQTGNPVYPLMYSWFGGEDWDDTLNAKWKAGHSPDDYRLADLGEKCVDVTMKSDWQSPLLFALAPLALFAGGNQRHSRWLWAYVLFLFFTWWTFTHRIDRFWVPMIPVVCLLAGRGAMWNGSRLWKFGATGLITAAVIFNLGFITTPLCGYNAYLIDMRAAREQTAAISAPGIQFLNGFLPNGAKVLCVGEAQVFDARFPLVYNTVFDRSIFVDWFAEKKPGVPAEKWRLRKIEEIRKTLAENGIAHLFVNWQEVDRYRKTYGYSRFVTQERFDELEKLHLLKPLLSRRHKTDPQIYLVLR